MKVPTRNRDCPVPAFFFANQNLRQCDRSHVFARSAVVNLDIDAFPKKGRNLVKGYVPAFGRVIKLSVRVSFDDSGLGAFGLLIHRNAPQGPGIGQSLPLWSAIRTADSESLKVRARKTDYTFYGNKSGPVFFCGGFTEGRNGQTGERLHRDSIDTVRSLAYSFYRFDPGD